MDIDALNLSPVERSCCLRNCLSFICKQLNCSSRNYPQEDTPTCPAHNLERARATMTTPTASVSTAVNMTTETDFGKYMKELEGKGRKSAELLHLLQLAVEADKKDKVSF